LVAVYTEASAECNSLAFSWLDNAQPRSWKIRICQISCNDPNKGGQVVPISAVGPYIVCLCLAPEGCTQYFTGTTNTVQSYNFIGGRHLANQKQLVCVR
jgi:hypothetical protein